MTPRVSRDAIRAAILEMAEAREGSFCPSEVARALAADWRGLMPLVRAEAAALQDEALIAATQKGRPVHADAARGPIRLKRQV